MILHGRSESALRESEWVAARAGGRLTLWVETGRLACGPGHPFYRRLNELLEAEGFDAHVERLCARFYGDRVGRPSLPPAVYFRLLLIGYFEGSTRAGDRVADGRFADTAGVSRPGLSDATPDHSIDVSGLVRSVRDSAGIQTDFEYDAAGRLTWEKPATGQDGWAEYDYENAASATMPANVHVRRGGASIWLAKCAR